jgi:hypothetical protein
MDPARTVPQTEEEEGERMTGPPYAFTLTWEGEVDRGVLLHPNDPVLCPTELWCIWHRGRRVGELEGEVDIGTARVTLWGRRLGISAWGGETPAEKFQRWIIHPIGVRWITEAEKNAD